MASFCSRKYGMWSLITMSSKVVYSNQGDKRRDEIVCSTSEKHSILGKQQEIVESSCEVFENKLIS